MDFQPGNLVKARDRVWVVQSDSDDGWLLLRPLGGADDEVTKLIPELETKPVELAQFALPDTSNVGSFNSGRILYNALRFQLRSSSGPFRCFGSINFEPRSYQFVPLLMAMRQKVVRLLIADDVGIGKTIESGLIVRELLDRGEIHRFAVLCPPHLVDQWCDELDLHFNIKATALTSVTSQQLERIVPHGHALTEYCPFLVVSLDYIKSDKNRSYFEHMPLDLVLVDEAHTCVRSTGSKQKRFDLLQKVTKDPSRHLLLLTATPHSGNDEAFFNLLSLIDEKFLKLRDETSVSSSLRRELAQHFIQRRRQDIKEWRVNANERITGFPVRMICDLTYKMDPVWHDFFEHVQDYCSNYILNYKEQDNSFDLKSASIYETLALLRCVSSSPAAAIQTLKNRLQKQQLQTTNSILGDDSEDDFVNLFSAQCMFEQEVDESEISALNDQEPSLGMPDSNEISKLIKKAQNLIGYEKDPKLRLLVSLVYDLVQEGYHPVIFCRFISTANYVSEQLKSILCVASENTGKTKLRKKAAKTSNTVDSTIEPFTDLKIGCVTGELVPEDRKARVEELMQANQRILVATDCLSEGINLQQGFTAVVHYDLAWNPTRHEQREGRVDRFGQQAPEVRCAMIYCENNTMDQLINNVLIQKDRNIQKALGISVPVPQQAEFIEKSVLLHMLTNRPQFRQSQFLDDIEAMCLIDLPDNTTASAPERIIEQLNIKWDNSLKNANKQRTIFAQAKIHPEEIAPLWQEQQDILGSFNDVLEFSSQACALFGCKLEATTNTKRKTFKQALTNYNWQSLNTSEPNKSNLEIADNNLKYIFPLEDINDLSLKQSLREEGFSHQQLLNFGQMYRASPFVNILSANVIEQALQGNNPDFSRCGIAFSEHVDVFTSIYLLRMRFQMKLTYNQQIRRHLMVEEIVPFMAQGLKNVTWDSSAKVRQLLLTDPAPGNFSSTSAQNHLNKALDLINNNQEQLNQLSSLRAEALKQEHSSIKEFTADGHVTQVIPCMPVDIMGIYVLIPQLD